MATSGEARLTSWKQNAELEIDIGGTRAISIPESAATSSEARLTSLKETLTQLQAMLHMSSWIWVLEFSFTLACKSRMPKTITVALRNGQPCSIKFHRPQRTTMSKPILFGFAPGRNGTQHGTHDRVAMAQLWQWLQFAMNGIDAMVAMLAMVNEGNGAIVVMVAYAPRSTSSHKSSLLVY